MGIGRALTRSGPARAEAGLCDAARTRAQLSRRIHRLLRTHQGVRSGRSARAWELRVAGGSGKRLEGGTAAARLAASQDRVLGSPREPAAAPVPRVPRDARLQAVEVLPRA